MLSSVNRVNNKIIEKGKMTKSRTIKETTILGLLKFLSLFPLSLNRRIGSVLGYLVWKFSKKQRHFSRCNLDHCYPSMAEDEKNRLLKQSLLESGKLVTELAIVWMGSLKKRNRFKLEVEGWQYLQQAHQKGHGVLMLTPHLGNWELFPQFILKDYSFSAMFRPPRMKALNEVIKNNREKDGARLFPITAGGIKNLIKSLNQGAVTVILPDQEPDPKAGIFSKFFDQDALTMTLAPRIYQKTKAEVLAACVLRTATGFRCQFQKIENIKRDDSIEKLVLSFNQAMENLINLSPEQYQWNYKRFYIQPEGRSQIYHNESD